MLDRKLAEPGINRERRAWYRDLRRYGMVPHAGFDLGFERTLVYITGPRRRSRRHPLPKDTRERAIMTQTTSVCVCVRGRHGKRDLNCPAVESEIIAGRR